MDVKVVDASALAAILFQEPEQEAIARRLEGGRLTAPLLLDYEIANVCVKKLRLHPKVRASIFESFLLRGGLNIESAEVDYAGAVVLAEQTGLSGYDASYLWLAQRTGAELVTLDRRLSRVAARLLTG